MPCCRSCLRQPNMTLEQQRIAIATACGWEIIGNEKGEEPNGLNKNWSHSDFRVIPDYLNDLNACHEMEKALTGEQSVDYCNALVTMLRSNYHNAIHASAAHRAEAFLRTLNLWTT